jgi:pentatricopeptide repeat protein
MPPPRRRTGTPIASTIFVDREEPKRTFEKAVFSIPAQGCLLRTWYGVGGQGKTALARELYRISDAKLEPSYSHLRRAMLDLHGRPISDPDRLLVWIRNAFSGAGVSFPAFDLAFAIMWQKTRGEEPLPNFDNPWLHRTGQAFSATIPDAVTVTRNLVDELSGTIPGLGFLVKQGTSWVFNKAKRAWLERTRPQMEAFYRNGSLVADHEMSALMAWMLAQDLNQHLAEHPTERFVLFIDEYERVMEGAGTGARWRENMFDAHMRSFVAETDGLLAIFFSRERLHWEDDPDWQDTLADHQHLLGGLSDKDAQKWLLSVPVASDEIRLAIIEGARETHRPTAPVYPLMLDLQVEHWRNLGTGATPQNFTVTAAGFEGRRRELIERLLRDYDDAVQDALSRLALVGRFDRVTFEHVITAFHLPLAFGAYDKLASLSILSTDEDGWLSLHRAIADAIVQAIDPETLAITRGLLRAHFESRALAALEDGAVEMAQTCLLEAIGLRRQDGHDGYADWLDAITEAFDSFHHDAFRQSIWEEALDLMRRASPAGHPNTATCLFQLATALIRRGRKAKAEPLLREALAIRQATLAPPDPLLAESYNALASTLCDLGDFSEAESLFEQALTMRRALFGENHLTTAQSYDEMAMNHSYKGDYAAADELYRKALEIRRSLHGEMRSNVATSYNNVAVNLSAQGRHAEAEPLFVKAIEISLAVDRDRAPETAAIYSNLARTAEDAGQTDRAEDLYRKALAIRLDTLGETHPDTASSYSRLGYLLQANDRLKEAEDCYRKALHIQRTTLGEADDNTVLSAKDLAITLMESGQIEDGFLQLQQTLDGARRCWGEEHAETADIYSLLAQYLDDHQRSAEAEPLHRKALEIRRTVLGAGHEEGIKSYHYLAGNLTLQDRWSEALVLCEEALAICGSALAKGETITAESHHTLGCLLLHENRLPEAEHHFRKALEILQKAAGPTHRRIASAHIALADACFEQGQFSAALPQYAAALSIIAPLNEETRTAELRDRIAACKAGLAG